MRAVIAIIDHVVKRSNDRHLLPAKYFKRYEDKE